MAWFPDAIISQNPVSSSLALVVRPIFSGTNGILTIDLSQATIDSLNSGSSISSGTEVGLVSGTIVNLASGTFVTLSPDPTVNFATGSLVGLVSGTIVSISPDLTVSLSTATLNALVTASFEPRPSSSSLSTISYTSSSAVTLASADPTRMGLYIYNDSDKSVYVHLGPAAAYNKFSFILPSTAYYESPIPAFDGLVTGIWITGGSGSAYITEIFA